MLRKREMHDAAVLFQLMKHPDVYPFVREKADSLEEYQFIMRKFILLEEKGELISRVIMNEFGEAVGTINLFDIEGKSGFLGTWLGKPYHGKGYNQIAKENFFFELIHEYGIENIFMKVRKTNYRSKKALEKFPYILQANTLLVRDSKFEELLNDYDLYVVHNELFLNYIVNENNLYMLDA